MLWTIFAVLALLAVGIVTWPQYRATGRFTPVMAIVIVLVVGVSAGLYYRIGSPGTPSGASKAPDPAAMVAGLEARLEEDPGDVEGWLMLARSYATLEQFDKSAQAYETVLRLQPDHPQALFFGGYIAAGRGELELAADRWQRILELGTAPQDVQASLEQQIAAWRGATASTPVGAATLEDDNAMAIRVSLSLSADAAAAVPADATVFVIARDPDNPRPPIAVVRRRVSELPTELELGDRDSMVPGRNLSAFARIEVIARVSLSGDPIAAAGDWTTSAAVERASGTRVDLVIDERLQ